MTVCDVCGVPITAENILNLGLVNQALYDQSCAARPFVLTLEVRSEYGVAFCGACIRAAINVAVPAPATPPKPPDPNSDVGRLAAMRQTSQDAVARDVAHRRRERTLCTEIAADMAADATALDGKPFNGNTIAHAFGTQGAAIAALAGVVERLLERLDG